jgi:hypothetical protein
MKLDQVTIPIEPRFLGESIDLAAALYRTDYRQVIGLTLLFGAPALLLGWLLNVFAGMGLWSHLVLFYFLSPLLGAVLVAGEGPRVFGEPFTVRAALSRFAAHLPRLLICLWTPRAVLCGIGFCLYAMEPRLLVVFLPAALFLSRHSTLTREVILLEQLQRGRLHRRVKDLNRGRPAVVIGQVLGTQIFFGCVVVIVFILIDLTSNVVLGMPVLLGRLPFEDLGSALPHLLGSDPRVILILMATMWIFYPLARLTLFLCYIDIRIREECWDLELDFRVEAQRLEALP